MADKIEIELDLGDAEKTLIPVMEFIADGDVNLTAERVFWLGVATFALETLGALEC